MLNELTILEGRIGERMMDELTAALRLLLQRQFLYSGDRGAAAAYNVLTDPRCRNFVDQWLDVLGLDFRHSEREQWIGVLPRADVSHLPTMPLAETLALLVVAQAWQEGANSGNFGERAVVQTTFNTLFDLYKTLCGRDRRETLKAPEFLRLIEGLERRNILRIGPYDDEAQDKDIAIRPMVMQLVSGTALETLEAYVRDEEVANSRAAAHLQAEHETGDDTVEEADA